MESKVTLEIEATIPDGAPEQVVRTVTENSRTLKFEVSGFEEECGWNLTPRSPMGD